MLNFSANVANRMRLGLLRQDCVLCGDEAMEVVCASCGARLPEDRETEPVPGCDRVVAAHAYRFPVDRLVQRFKFAGDLAVGAWLAARLAARVHDEPRPDAIVPTPLAPARLRERGFNQAQELARIVGRELRVPLARGITRVRSTDPQAGLRRVERQRNLRDAFRVGGDVRGMRIALVDDVVTTGATAESLARSLLRAGAERVSVWAVARTPGPEMG